MRLILGAGINQIPGNPHRKKLVFRNNSATTCYWGWESDVAADTGIPLAEDEGFIIDGGDNNLVKPLYFVGATAEIRYTEQT